MNTDILIQKLKNNIDNAGHLKPNNGSSLIPAGIISVDEINQTVTYLHGNALFLINEAKNKKLPIQPIVDNPFNSFTHPVKEFSDFVLPPGDVSRWR